MNYPIQMNREERAPREKTPIDADVMAAAIAGVIHNARQKGQTLEELKAEVLADDSLLQQDERFMLSDIVAEAWEKWPDSL